MLMKKTGVAVTNLSSSRMLDDIAAASGSKVVRTAVGEANVVRVMQEQSAVFGGEGNGGPIDPEVGHIRDSFVGMVWILYAMACRGLPVSRLASELPRYEICKTKQEVPRKAIPRALNHFLFVPRLPARVRRSAHTRIERLLRSWNPDPPKRPTD